MKKTLLLLTIFLVVGSATQISADDETDLVRNYLNMSFSKNIVRTGKATAASNGVYSSYMKNPVFSMGFEKPFSNRAYAFKFAGLGLELDVSGKYSLKKKVAGFEKKIADESLRETLFNRIADFRVLLARLFYLNQKKSILKLFTKKTEKLSEELALLVEGKSHSELDLMRVNSLLLSHRRKQVLVDSEVAALKAVVKEICGTVPATLKLEVPALIDLNQIRSRALKESPEIIKTQISLAGSSMSLDLAKRSIAPDLGIELGFMKASVPGIKPEYSIEVGLSFELPVFDFNKKDVARTKSLKYQTVLELSEKKRVLSLRLTELHENIKHIKNNFEIDENKNEILEKSMFLYRKGEISIGDLISTIYEIEELNFSDIELEENVHYLTLDLYATAGFFENDKINDLIEGAIK